MNLGLIVDDMFVHVLNSCVKNHMYEYVVFS